VTSYIFNLSVFKTNFFILFYYNILKPTGGAQTRQFSAAASLLGRRQFKKRLPLVPKIENQLIKDSDLLLEEISSNKDKPTTSESSEENHQSEDSVVQDKAPLNEIKPVAVYLDADIDKQKILSENTPTICVYR